MILYEFAPPLIHLLKVNEAHFIVIVIPYSGKFSHGTKFRVFRGLVNYHENKNRETLNLHVRVYVYARATERARA